MDTNINKGTKVGDVAHDARANQALFQIFDFKNVIAELENLERITRIAAWFFQLFHDVVKSKFADELGPLFLEGSGVTTLDFAKALIDEGYHPMTMYFPLVVHGAMLIEPTETETKQELDAFVAAMQAISDEAHREPETVTNAPHLTRLRRLDETRAARSPVLRYTRPAAS